MRAVIIFLSLIVAINALELPNIEIPKVVKNLGKKTPIDIALYVKNNSTKCTLKIKNISNPYNMDISKKLPILIIKPGRYYRKNVDNILKGKYEFEYSWYKEGKFIDSGVKEIHIFSYHDRSLPLYKSVDLTFKDVMPKECQWES